MVEVRDVDVVGEQCRFADLDVEVAVDRVPPANTVWFDLVKVPCTPYDPTDAKRLVAKYGVSNPTVRLLTNNTSDFLRAAEFVQEQEKQAGISVVWSSDFSSPWSCATTHRRDTSGGMAGW